MTELSDGHARDLFDQALKLRDEGALGEACRLLEEMIARGQSNDQRLLAHAHLQLANMHGKQGRHREGEDHFRAAARLAPKLELASLGLFHSLFDQGRLHDALSEALRFVTLRESLAYRELFAGQGYGDDLPLPERAVASEVRAQLASHRSKQNERALPVRGDTVRVHPSAPTNCRPDALARLRSAPEAGSEGMAVVTVEFTDGESVQVPLSLLDHHDI